MQIAAESDGDTTRQSAKLAMARARRLMAVVVERESELWEQLTAQERLAGVGEEE